MRKLLVGFNLLFLLVGCQPKMSSKTMLVEDMIYENLQYGLMVTPLESEVIVETRAKAEILDSLSCHLDFSACTAEGECEAKVVCDNENVSVIPTTIKTTLAYPYGKYADIPEFANNFAKGKFHASDEYPRLLVLNGMCEVIKEQYEATNWVNCDKLKEEYDVPYVEAITDRLFPGSNKVNYISYKDDSYYRYYNTPLNEEQLKQLNEALTELEVVTFFPHYMGYEEAEEFCPAYSIVFDYELNSERIFVYVHQYDNSEMAFVSVRTPYPEYTDSFHAYVKVHDFFPKIADLMQDGLKSKNAIGACTIK